MTYREEKFKFEEKEYMRMFQTRDRQRELHCHSCLELNFVEKGTGTYIIGGKMYPMEPGDMFVINNSEQHLALHNSPDLTLTVLILETGHLWRSPSGVDYLKPFLGRNKSFSNRISSDEEDYPEMSQIFSWLKKELLVADDSKEGLFEVQVARNDVLVGEAAINLFLALLYRHYERKKELSRENGTDFSLGPVSKVFSYINEHFSEKITLEELAKECSLSRTYLSKYFKELTGQTLFTYIQQTRVQYASYLLQTSKKSMAEIAMEAGFETVSYFNRIFKKYYGISPSRFRGKE